MEISYSKEQLHKIAKECKEFEHVISAMGYGYSLANVSTEQMVRQCTECVNWQGGECSIFRREIEEWG